MPFQHTLPYQSHSETSQAAAEQAAPKATRLRKLVYDYIVSRGGATDEEIQDALGMNGSTQRPRRVELVAAGLVRDSGTTRRTKRGRNAVVWIDSTQETR